MRSVRNSVAPCHQDVRQRLWAEAAKEMWPQWAVVRRRSTHLRACVLAHCVQGTSYGRPRSEFGEIRLKEHGGCNSGIPIFAFNLLTLYTCHFFSIGYEPFRLETLPLGREEKLWVMETETQGDGPSGERRAAPSPHHLPAGHRARAPASHYPASSQQLSQCVPAPVGRSVLQTREVTEVSPCHSICSAFRDSCLGTTHNPHGGHLNRSEKASSGLVLTCGLCFTLGERCLPSLRSYILPALASPLSSLPSSLVCISPR